MNTVRHLFHRSWLVGLLTTLLLAGIEQVVLLPWGGGMQPVRAEAAAPAPPAAQAGAPALEQRGDAPVGAFLPEQAPAPLALHEQQGPSGSAELFSASQLLLAAAASSSVRPPALAEEAPPSGAAHARARLALLHVLRC